jgi:predicted Zn-dependent protease with MMP-like domain
VSPSRDEDERDDPRWAGVEEAIELGEFERAETLIDELADDFGDDHPDVLYERVALAWEREGPEAALGYLDELLRVDPEHADAHYLRGLVCGDVGDRAGMIEHFLATLRLDELFAAEHGLDDDADELDFIEVTAEQVLAGVPAEFNEHLRDVPIVLEARPHPDLVREQGFDPRSLGLFEGLEQGRLAIAEPAVAPTRIVLYYANLLADFPNRRQLADEIEITILHEIGHFFGLGEDDLERLGLE